MASWGVSSADILPTAWIVTDPQGQSWIVPCIPQGWVQRRKDMRPPAYRRYDEPCHLGDHGARLVMRHMGVPIDAE